MTTYRVDLYTRKPLQFCVERLNAHGRVTDLVNYRSTLLAAIRDAEFWGGGAIEITDAALAAGDKPRYRTRAVNKQTLTAAQKLLAMANAHRFLAELRMEKRDDIDEVLESLRDKP